MGALGDRDLPADAATGLPGNRRGPVLDDLPPPSARAGTPATTIEDDDGNIWFTAARAGVFRYDGTTFTNDSEQDGLTSGIIHRADHAQDGRIWCVGWAGAFRKDGPSFVNVTRDWPW